MSDRKVRVRFAPSPTGPLHIGGVRTALFNYLFAQKHQGDMVVRIEDTDQTRFVAGAESYIQEALDWCGIQIDESPWHGGNYSPYRQSERKHLYQQYAQQLVENDHAYYAFDTPEELDAMRDRLKAARVATPQYNAITRAQMKNSLTLSEDEVKSRMEAGEPYVIRLKVPRKEEIRLKDMVRGWVMVHSHTLDDKVLMKADGMPTYHLANVVDDHLMQISHVIRGEEWLPSAPLHVLLYRYLGWEETMPEFAHLPLLLRPDGKGKLSKRDGDKLGFSVFPINWQVPNEDVLFSGFREDGYLPEAFVNFLAFLGWSPGDQREMFTMEELVEHFTIERVGKAGIKFDIDKAKWYNQQYLKQKSAEELGQILMGQAQSIGHQVSEEKAAQIAELMKDRITFPKDYLEQAGFFFDRPEAYDEKVVKKKWNAEVADVLGAYAAALRLAEGDFSADQAKAILNQVLDEKGMKMGKVMQSLRVAITGMGAGPDLMPLISIIGQQEVADRLDLAIERLA